MYPSFSLSLYLSLSLSLLLSPSPSHFLSLYLIHPSIHPSIRPSVRPSIHPSLYLEGSNFARLLQKMEFAAPKRQKAARLPPFLKNRSKSARFLQQKTVHSSKATNFGETSSIFEVDNIKTEAIPRDVFKKWKFTAPKRQNFARPPPFLKLTTSKPKQFCETSSKKESSQLQSDKLRQDFLHFWSWQHQNRSNSARRPQKMKVHSSKATKFC